MGWRCQAGKMLFDTVLIIQKVIGKNAVMPSLGT